MSSWNLLNFKGSLSLRNVYIVFMFYRQYSFVNIEGYQIFTKNILWPQCLLTKLFAGVMGHERYSIFLYLSWKVLVKILVKVDPRDNRERLENISGWYSTIRESNQTKIKNENCTLGLLFTQNISDLVALEWWSINLIFFSSLSQKWN